VLETQGFKVDLNFKDDYINTLKLENQKLWQQLDEKDKQIQDLISLNKNSQILPINNGLILALGYFDGLHLAHQKLIEQTIDLAKSYKSESGLMTFHPNPKHFLGRQTTEQLLTPHNMKIDLLDKMGVDYLFVVQFDE